MRLRRRKGALAVAVAVLFSTGMVWQSSQAAFKASTSNPGGSWGTGTVALTDNDASDTKTLFTLSNVKPGDTNTSCITVTYSGNLAGLVDLYATTTGSGLAPYVTLTVTRGTGAATFGDCSTFVADSANFFGSGAGIVYTGNLSAFPAAAGSLTDPHAAGSVAEAWTNGETHTYKFTTVVQDNNTAQGKNLTSAFTWKATPTTLYSQVIRSDNPSSYWRLDEAAGTTATDAIGVTNGTYTNGPTLNQSTTLREANTAVSFDGSDDRVDFGNVYGFGGTVSFSAEMWLRPGAAINEYRRVLAKEGANQAGWTIELNATSASPSNSVQVKRADAGGGKDIAGSTSGLQAGVWYHVVATYDGANLRIYVDSVLQQTVASARSAGTHANPLRLGMSSAWTNADRYTGAVDELAVYSYALSAQQIIEHYNAGKP